MRASVGSSALPMPRSTTSARPHGWSQGRSRTTTALRAPTASLETIQARPAGETALRAAGLNASPGSPAPGATSRGDCQPGARTRRRNDTLRPTRTTSSIEMFVGSPENVRVDGIVKSSTRVRRAEPGNGSLASPRL